jgi:cytochrome P450
MEAGSDTTASTLLSFLLAMIKYPKELRKAQEEVDAVCGSSKSPTSNDIGRLPFIKALMDEVRRLYMLMLSNVFTLMLNTDFRHSGGAQLPLVEFLTR